MIKGGRRLATIALAVFGFVAGATGAAWADVSTGKGVGGGPSASPPRSTINLPDGPWAEQCAANGSATVCQKGTFQGYREDQNRGSRLQASASFKEVGWKSDIRGAFVEVQWWAHTNSCYPTSFRFPSINCSTGWWASGSPYQTGRTVSDTYVTWEVWWHLDPAGSSGRGQFKGCLDVALGFDTCTAYILRGADYD